MATRLRSPGHRPNRAHVQRGVHQGAGDLHEPSGGRSAQALRISFVHEADPGACALRGLLWCPVVFGRYPHAVRILGVHADSHAAPGAGFACAAGWQAEALRACPSQAILTRPLQRLLLRVLPEGGVSGAPAGEDDEPVRAHAAASIGRAWPDLADAAGSHASNWPDSICVTRPCRSAGGRCWAAATKALSPRPSSGGRPIRPGVSAACALGTWLVPRNRAMTFAPMLPIGEWPECAPTQSVMRRPSSRCAWRVSTSDNVANASCAGALSAIAPRFWPPRPGRCPVRLDAQHHRQRCGPTTFNKWEAIEGPSCCGTPYFFASPPTRQHGHGDVSRAAPAGEQNAFR